MSKYWMEINNYERWVVAAEVMKISSSCLMLKKVKNMVIGNLGGKGGAGLLVHKLEKQQFLLMRIIDINRIS